MFLLLLEIYALAVPPMEVPISIHHLKVLRLPWCRARPCSRPPRWAPSRPRTPRLPPSRTTRPRAAASRLRRCRRRAAPPTPRTSAPAPITLLLLHRTIPCPSLNQHSCRWWIEIIKNCEKSVVVMTVRSKSGPQLHSRRSRKVWRRSGVVNIQTRSRPQTFVIWVSFPFWIGAKKLHIWLRRDLTSSTWYC